LRVGVFGLSLICLGAVGLLAIQGYFEGYALAAPSNWLAAGLGFGLIGLAAALVFDYHLNGMENRLAQSREALKDLELERQRLENQADWSGRELERRLIQVRTLAEINGAANSLLDVGQLLPRLCELVRERFGLHAVEVFLMDAETQDAYLAAGTGDAGPQKLSEGYRLQVDDESITGWSIGHRQACTDLESDKGEAPLDVARFTNLRLPGGAPKLALPILNQREVLGAMTVHFNAEAVFDQDDFLALKGLADSLAKAIENARLNSEIQSNLDEISSLHRQYLQHAWRQALEASGEREYVYTGKPDASETQANGKEHTATQAHEFSIRLRGQAIGCLSLEVEAERAFNDEERNLIETVIGQAAQALETARLLDETRQRAEQENVAASLSNRIWSSTDVEAILKTALQELGKSLGATEGSIELWPERQPEADLPHDDRLGSRNVLN
jgi:GAF domain-containing protein